MHEQCLSDPSQVGTGADGRQRPAGPCCPACKAEAEAGNRFCSGCGKELGHAKEPTPDTGPPDPAGSPVAPGPQEARQPDGGPRAQVNLPLVGPNAPADVPPKPKAQACGNCGRAPAEGAKFCDQCGDQFGEVTPRYRLVGVNAASTGRVVSLGKEELTIGKATECQFAMPDDDYASRRHARIFRSEGKLLLEDLKSSNGTFLKVRRPIALEVGDEIAIGTSLIRLEEIGVHKLPTGEATCLDRCG